jgi:hypothetical protein
VVNCAWALVEVTPLDEVCSIARPLRTLALAVPSVTRSRVLNETMIINR